MYRDGTDRRLGVVQGSHLDQVVDLHALARATGSPMPPADLLGLIDAGDEELKRVTALLTSPKASGSSVVRSLTELTLLPPLDPPRGNVLAIGRNYQKHAEEGARALHHEVDRPTIFTKAITAIIGPNADITIDPSVSEQVDWEAELGVVIGCRGANIRRDEALAHVFGYTVVNDVTARDIQNGWGGQWFKGKSLDSCCPTGPWVVTKDEIQDPQALRVRLRVNGQLKQDATTKDMIYPVKAIIEWLSVGMTLLPGALIATGTPEGVGFARNPPEFLRPGDVVETEVERIGVLRNRIVDSRATDGDTAFH
jgi:2-keto-4-pentenoate hydratase/2-oxohepta-3-ene-1,7-dioic acid hydratase in catechol pathway